MALLDLSLVTYENYDDYLANARFWEPLVLDLLKPYGVHSEQLTHAKDGANVVFLTQTHVLKLYPPFHQHQFQSEQVSMSHLTAPTTVRIPKLYAFGALEQDWHYLIMERLPGQMLYDVWPEMNEEARLLFVTQVGRLIAEMHRHPITEMSALRMPWPEFLRKQRDAVMARHQRFSLPSHLLGQIPQFLDAVSLPLDVPEVYLTSEYTPWNLFLSDDSGQWQLSAMIDFGDAMLGAAEYDLTGPSLFYLAGLPQLMKPFLKSYGYTDEQMNHDLARRLMAYTLLHRYANLEFQITLKDWQNLPDWDAVASAIWF